jgi:hypothetical protein
MNFEVLGLFFVEFSEDRDLFVNIFQILDLTAKIVDHGLILENLRGSKCKIGKIWTTG